MRAKSVYLIESVNGKGVVKTYEIADSLQQAVTNFLRDYAEEVVALSPCNKKEPDEICVRYWCPAPEGMREGRSAIRLHGETGRAS